MRKVGAVLVLVLSIAAGATPQDQPLVASRDVDPPKKVHAPPPAYPPAARNARLQGLILLEITLSAEGRPTNIRVLRSIPLLDHAAAEAVKTWRYEPTLVNDVPRRVVVVEGLDFFLSDADMARAYADIARSRREPSEFRLYAVSRLLQLPQKRRKIAVRTLQKLLRDPDDRIASAAESALEKLATVGK